MYLNIYNIEISLSTKISDLVSTVYIGTFLFKIYLFV